MHRYSHLALLHFSFFLICRFVSITATCTLFLKNDTDVARYNYNMRQPFLVIFGKDVAESVCSRIMVYFSTSPD